MKKISLFVFVMIAGLVFLSSQFLLPASSAQETTKVSNEDLLLAETLKQLTDRSNDGLTQRPAGSGGFMIDLEGGFQNVMLSKIDADGEPVAGCITGLGEANEFFGRNLETGEAIISSSTPKSERASVAAQHGMTEKEFNFYQKLIEDAAAQRAGSPDAATLVIVNADGAGEGFNDGTPVGPEGGNTGATRGEQRQSLFNFAAGIWGAFLDSNVPINVRSQFNPQQCSTSGGVLGSAGASTVHRNFPNAQFPDTHYPAALANKRAGSDLNPSTAEINATFNSDIDNGCLGAGSSFYYGLNNTTPPGRINLLIVLLHEMGHGLGFQSFANGTTGALFVGFPDVFTRNMFDRTTSKYWHQMTDAERQASALNTGNVLWDGANVKIASGFLTGGRETATGRVQLFTPNPFQSGSSISHFSTAAFPNLLMEPNINVGLPLTLDLTRQQMRDIGWYRDTTADLVPDMITDVQPSGNTIVIGNSVAITWTNTGGFNRNVTIDLSTDGGATYPTTLATDIPNTGSFIFTVPNTPTTLGKVRVREHNFVDPAGISNFNFSISTTPPSSNRKLFDFDGDNKADISVFRPSNGVWYLNQSTAGFNGIAFGADSDTLVPADYDGDGKTDVATFRTSNGTWYVQGSQAGFYGVVFGAGSDIPVPADYDGDGKSDIAVFRPSNGVWYIQGSMVGFYGVSFGANGDKPVAADYDGDNKADVAVFRPSNGVWYLQQSTQGFTGVGFGDAADKLVPADYDGDNKTDIAVFRPSNGVWYIRRSLAGFIGISFGAGNDIPTPADYDGDGRADISVFRDSNGVWYQQRTAQGFTGIAFGTGGDKPAPNAYVR